jgi:hypothetical protein
MEKAPEYVYALHALKEGKLSESTVREGFGHIDGIEILIDIALDN